MRTFLTLFKHERRSLFPSLRLKRRPDVIGGFLSLCVSLMIIGIFLFLVATVTDSYIVLKLDKISDPAARALELLNALYAIAIVALAGMCLEKMRTSFVSFEGKKIFLRIPVSHRMIFFTKLATLLLWTYVTAFFFILPINAIFYRVLNLGVDFIINSLKVWLFLPLASFLIATVLIVPYMRLVKFFSTRYFLTFLLLSGTLVAAFYLYSEMLAVLQGFFEKGSIKFLFSDAFINALQTLLNVTYPANALASIALGTPSSTAFLIVSAIAAAAILFSLLVTKKLYKITLFKNENKKAKRGRKRVRARGPLGALMHKEFISVFREPKYLFSYFSIALTMPFMVYCCYTLFETLILNSIGRSFDLALAMIVVLVFSILTNTFCATNITRDGLTALKAKIFPIKPSRILLSKVLFCNVISSLSVIAGVVVLALTTNLKPLDAVTVGVIGLIFSLSQIFIATRMDLNHARVASGPQEMSKASNRTIAKTITIGLLLAIIIGFLSLFLSVFAGARMPEALLGIMIYESYPYLFPLAISLLYLLFSRLYYSIRINNAFENLVR